MLRNTLPALAAALSLLVLAVLLPGAPAQAKEFEVDQVNRSFKPGKLAVKIGDTVVFKNQDTVAHNIFSASAGNEFDLHIQRPGKASFWKAVKAGTVVVRCAIHPAMKLEVQVSR